VIVRAGLGILFKFYRVQPLEFLPFAASSGEQAQERLCTVQVMPAGLLQLNFFYLSCIF
jgi:hypothetical protein